MNTSIDRIFSRTGAVVTAVGRDFASINAANGRNAPLLMLALTPPLLAAFALTEIGTWALDEIGRQLRIREKRPVSPSLRGTPTPADLAAPWTAQPRTLRDRLRLGSRLADLDPTLDHTISRRTLSNGKTVFRARPGGVKGWLEDRRVAIPYSTAMRYKKLAQRLRQILSLDDRLPLEWLIDGLPAGQSLPSVLQSPYQAARRRLAAILRENPTLKALSLHAEKKLGIVRLVAVRKAPARRRSASEKRRKTTGFSVISRGHSVAVTPERFEATKAAISRILEAPAPSGPALHLRNRLLRWLTSLPPRPQA
ncbi:MAG: hypothetical protein IKQ55_02285 [Kiritimatiellae bacterium]|nr:hypothetical protein [Kiritimatiellia bacterium]